MESLFFILFALLDSSFISLSFLQRWSEELIEFSKSPQDWLIEISMCTDVEDALKVLRTCLASSGEILDEKYGETLIGFLYLRYKNKRLSFDRFTVEVLDVIDAYEVVNLDLESLLQVLKSTQTLEKDREHLLRQTFERCGERSHAFFNYLISDNFYYNEKQRIER